MLRGRIGANAALLLTVLAARAARAAPEAPDPDGQQEKKREEERSIGTATWPLWTMHAPPAGKEVRLAAREALSDMDLDPRGGLLAFVVRDPTRADSGTLRLWDFKRAPAAPSAPDLAGRSIDAAVFSVFDGSLYVASSAPAPARDHRIDRFAVDAGQPALRKLNTVFAGQARLHALVTGLVEYDNRERIYFAREHAPNKAQIVSAVSNGMRVYELTSPTGKPSDVTDKALREPAGHSFLQPPSVTKAESAVPVSLAPDGVLIWRDGDGKLWQQGYRVNWKAATAIPDGGPGVSEVATSNGYFRVRWRGDAKGFELINGEHKRRETIAADTKFASPPLLAASGRGFVGRVETPDGTALRTFAIKAPIVAARHLAGVPLSADESRRLERDGLLFTPTDASQIYTPYERLKYEELGCGSRGGALQPIFASIDGFFEVLNAAFEAVFILGEQQLSRPALRDLVTQLRRAGTAMKNDRLVRIADATDKVLAGNLDHPEGKLIKAGASAPSALPIGLDPGKKVDYGGFLPRGPYAANKTLSAYFRAFKLINALELRPEEQKALAADAAFVAAVRRWTDVQRPFLPGTRRPTLFDVGAQRAGVTDACVPERVRGQPPSMFPLGWSVDSEVLEGTINRSVPPACGAVPNRGLPTGLDLLAGFGSAKAVALSADEYKRYPTLAAAHTIGQKKAAVLRNAATFVDTFLHAIQTVASDSRKLEAVSPDLWQRRLLQSSLGAWVGLRHTLVLVQEEGGAECDNSHEVFEEMSLEPAGGAVDPMPEAWKDVATLLDRLAAHAAGHKVARHLRDRLHEAAGVARKFGGMAERQIRGVPLKADEYRLIEEFGRTVEHPYLLFKSALAHASEEGSIIIPDPMMKIVDIQRGPQGEYWHVATGRPLSAIVMLGDRGVLLPAAGAVYSYYEVTAPAPVNDEMWRARLDKEQQPWWAVPLVAGRPKPPAPPPETPPQ
jgi:hypothetical protein